jgi:hypothetical protein
MSCIPCFFLASHSLSKTFREIFLELFFQQIPLRLVAPLEPMTSFFERPNCLPFYNFCDFEEKIDDFQAKTANFDAILMFLATCPTLPLSQLLPVSDCGGLLDGGGAEPRRLWRSAVDCGGLPLTVMARVMECS